MKANELTIGDFFLYKGNVVEIVSIDGGTETAWIDGKKVSALKKVEDLQPIPLTPEILEKNDWKLYSHENTPIYGMIKGFEIVLAWMDCYWQLCVDGTLYRKIRIRYVHELRHALKLCGIKKEIEL